MPNLKPKKKQQRFKKLRMNSRSLLTIQTKLSENLTNKNTTRKLFVKKMKKKKKQTEMKTGKQRDYRRRRLQRELKQMKRHQRRPRKILKKRKLQKLQREQLKKGHTLIKR